MGSTLVQSAAGPVLEHLLEPSSATSRRRAMLFALLASLSHVAPHTTCTAPCRLLTCEALREKSCSELTELACSTPHGPTVADRMPIPEVSDAVVVSHTCARAHLNPLRTLATPLALMAGSSARSTRCTAAAGQHSACPCFPSTADTGGGCNLCVERRARRFGREEQTAGAVPPHGE